MPILFEPSVACTGLAFVTLSNPARLGAMNRAMWAALRHAFEQAARDDTLRCVVVRGEGGAFCAGGDIAEYPAFRFHAESLRAFHEEDVWGGLRAMLQCDVPIVAQIDGACMGAGLEIAACCDIRIAADAARFGAPIARLGFPMAPRELQLLTREAGRTPARSMLLEARVFSAAEMQASGFLSRVVPGADTAMEAMATARRVCALAPQAARLNKRMLRAMDFEPPAHASADAEPDAYAYADSAEHREGVAAFLQKRPPSF
jgi:enoyl-CoA hydratase/carnithine racemase